MDNYFATETNNQNSSRADRQLRASDRVPPTHPPTRYPPADLKKAQVRAKTQHPLRSQGFIPQTGQSKSQSHVTLNHPREIEGVTASGYPRSQHPNTFANSAWPPLASTTCLALIFLSHLQTQARELISTPCATSKSSLKNSGIGTPALINHS